MLTAKGIGRSARLTAAIALAALAAPVLATAARCEEAAFATAWASEPATRVRLVAGGQADPGRARRLMAGVEIELDEGWKTYWRNPGSSGVPPRLDFAASENLAEAAPLYPAPERIADREGDIIGYKKAVMLPVVVVAKDPSLPVTLRLALEYGVCKDVCIPVQPTLELLLPADAASRPAGSRLAAALERVPRVPEERRPGDPELKRVTIEAQGAKPHIEIEAAFAGDAAGADAFLEAPDGIWIPLAKPQGPPAGGVQRFLVDLTDGADIADLKGRTIRLTLVGRSGATDTSFIFE